MIEKYKDICYKLKIDYKKDITITCGVGLLFLIGGITSFVLYSHLIGIMAIACGIVYFVMHFLNIRSSVKRLINFKEIAFNGFYRYVVTLLKNNQVLYAALQSSLQYVDEVLLDDVNELISAIEEDTSLDPFLKFMNNFEDETIKQMVILLYKTQESGIIDEVIESINESMIYLQDTSIKTYIQKEEKRIERYYIFPIILSAIVMILISIYVFSLIGDGIYV